MNSRGKRERDPCYDDSYFLQMDSSDDMYQGALPLLSVDAVSWSKNTRGTYQEKHVRDYSRIYGD